MTARAKAKFCSRIGAFLGGLLAITLSSPSHADAIDGQWCFASKSLEIQGPNITTPGGNKINGEYSRHSFRYVVPANEPEPGTEVAMMLHGEELMELSRKGTATPESWRRCKPIS